MTRKDLELRGFFEKAARAIEDEPFRAPRRRRKGSPVFALRLTPLERSRLEAMAGETPLATYIKFRLFNHLPPLAQLGGNRKATDTKLIAQLLAVLGEARLSQNLNQLARHANMGTLDVTPEVERQLQDACADIKAMRHDLMTALGAKAKAS